MLLALLRGTGGLVEHVARHPLDYSRWTEPQEEYLTNRSNRKLLRIGNGGGKSRVALADVVMRARKSHPFRPDWNARRGPTKQWITTVTWSQAVPLMQMLRSFLGEGELAKAPNWDPAKGWGKDSPVLVWPDGSTVGWRTSNQGPLAHAGAELDHILIDEPVAAETYRELERRVARRGGDLSLAMTPINCPGDIAYLRDLCTEGIVTDLNFPMNERLFRYTDGDIRRLPDGTPCDATWIAEQIRQVLPAYRDIVINGGWDEITVDGRFTDAFSRSRHVAEFRLDGSEVLSLGTDHGSQAFTETAVLVAVDQSKEYPHIYILDTYEAQRDSPADADARAILEMLARHGKRWGSLKHVTGDIAHYGGRGRINRKSNQELAYEIARELQLGRNASLVPPIRTAKTGAGAGPRGSVYRGTSWLYRALLREGHVTVHPRCVSLIKAFENYKGGSTDEHGHLVDALRYALDPWINRGQQRNVPSATVVVG
jgi:hypothetical protein